MNYDPITVPYLDPAQPEKYFLQVETLKEFGSDIRREKRRGTTLRTLPIRSSLSVARSALGTAFPTGTKFFYLDNTLFSVEL